ncbi:hypothetical protein PR048_029304 [Dryococelus australis]|uniref:Uncharacterized protein n=1 Tax=Dryococelus australis TaxID=614101 RepID=A0ABQ9GFQ5_9NEOP|nr:hypothetical protein PR048_029304 [Dryococelus australis]
MLGHGDRYRAASEICLPHLTTRNLSGVPVLEHGDTVLGGFRLQTLGYKQHYVDTCTPVQSPARRGDGGLIASASVALTAPVNSGPITDLHWNENRITCHLVRGRTDSTLRQQPVNRKLFLVDTQDSGVLACRAFTNAKFSCLCLKVVHSKLSTSGIDNAKAEIVCHERKWSQQEAKPQTQMPTPLLPVTHQQHQYIKENTSEISAADSKNINFVSGDSRCLDSLQEALVLVTRLELYHSLRAFHTKTAMSWAVATREPISLVALHCSLNAYKMSTDPGGKKSEGIWAALNVEVLRADGGGKRGEYRAAAGMTGAGETGDHRENPPTISIVRHDSHVRKSGSAPPPPHKLGIKPSSPCGETASLPPGSSPGGVIRILTSDVWCTNEGVPRDCETALLAQMKQTYSAQCADLVCPRPNATLYSPNSTARMRGYSPIRAAGLVQYRCTTLFKRLKRFVCRPSLQLRARCVFEPMRVIDTSMDRRRNERTGETEDLREKKNPPTNGIAQHDYQHAKIGSDPDGGRTRIALVGGEQGNRSATAAPH